MTENECVETLQYLLGYENAVDKGELDLPNYLNSEEKEALKFILEEIQQYRAIGTVEECRVAVERMKPKKPFFNGANYECPNCYTRPYADDAKDKKPMLCDICGQRLDWQ